ncbi:aminoglycoside phosphotransferase family protein [Jiangella gansuensis]|uniref:aminoglycoside phosphotransferase family protein n=1 Tax=Jiangella gansuensis TaxID=281473 RepID=UPI00047E7292|nr:aminoglycoside phosphotransferase family protein [Jiangella gansuensis]
MTAAIPDDVPAELVASYGRDDAGRSWLAGLPRLVADTLERWSLRPDGPSANGMASLVVPVLRTDGEPAVLRLQPVSDDNAGAALGLRTWNGVGIVRLLDHDPGTGAMLLERLDASRPLAVLTDDDTVMTVLAELLARLAAVEAPAGLRRLADVATAMIDQTPAAVPALHDPAEQRLVRTCAAVVADLVPDAGECLLHWDLHDENVLAGQREPWLAIDPEPLAGDPGFDLWPALNSRWNTIVASSDPVRAVLRRFDLMTEIVGVGRERATGWTLGRVLQNALWDIEDGKTALDPPQVTLAEVLLRHRSR